MSKPERTSQMESLILETNDLLKKQIILQLVVLGASQQSIRKAIGGDINYINNFLRPLKGKINVK